MYSALPHTKLSAEEFADRLMQLPEATPRLELAGADIFKFKDDDGLQMLVANDGHYVLVELGE